MDKSKVAHFLWPTVKYRHKARRLCYASSAFTVAFKNMFTDFGITFFLRNLDVCVRII